MPLNSLRLPFTIQRRAGSWNAIRFGSASNLTRFTPDALLMGAKAPSVQWDGTQTVLNLIYDASLILGLIRTKELRRIAFSEFVGTRVSYPGHLNLFLITMLSWRTISETRWKLGGLNRASSLKASESEHGVPSVPQGTPRRARNGAKLAWMQ